jgi:hypothetical protein
VNPTSPIVIRLIPFNKVAQSCRSILSDRNTLGVVPVGSIQSNPIFQRARTKLDAIPGGKACLICFDQIAARTLHIQSAGIETNIIVAYHIIVGCIEDNAAIGVVVGGVRDQLIAMRIPERET